MKALCGTPKHISRQGNLSGFTYLMLTLPFKCNYRCLKCFNLVGDEPVTTGDVVTLDETLAVIAEAKNLGGKVVVIAGEGEPTLDKNIVKIVSFIHEMEMIPIVYSNGTSLNSAMINFYHSRQACLVIALDSLKPGVYQYLSGTKPDMLSVVLKNVENLRKVYAKSIKEADGLQVLRLALNMTVCSKNKEEIEEIKAFAAEDMYFICNPMARHGNAVGNWLSLIDNEKEYVEHQRLASKNSQSGGPLTLNNIGVCGYSLNGIGIGPYGHYMTCAYTYKTNGLLGTIRDHSLKDAYEFKTRVERQSYAIHGRVPCLVRATWFDSFLKTLKDDQP